MFWRFQNFDQAKIKLRVPILLLLLFHVKLQHGKAENDPLHDLPPILDSSDIAFFSSTYDLEGLYWALSNVFFRSERNPNAEDVKHELPQAVVSKGGGNTYTTEYKVKLDLEQAEYIAYHSITATEDFKKYYRNVVIPTLRKLLEMIPPLDQLQKTGGLYGFREYDYNTLEIQSIYNKAFHNPEYEYSPRRIFSKEFQLKKKEIQKQWFESDQPGVLVVDNLLSTSTLSTIQTLLLENTVWYQTKMPEKFGGYVGAYIDDGLHQKILLALAFELHKALPDIMTGHDLKYLWAYKYDSDYTGINTHADQAAVNVNIWLTPDEANLDPESGGLVIYTTKPPSDWDFDAYNMDTERVEEDILKPTSYANVTVPYKMNRAVIFDSALFHHTDKFNFKKGYKNRRINLTILYGEMQRECKDPAACASTS